MTEFTVAVHSARGAFHDLEEAKKDAIRLAKLNAPHSVYVEDKEGNTLFFYNVDSEGRVTQCGIDLAEAKAPEQP